MNKVLTAPPKKKKNEATYKISKHCQMKTSKNCIKSINSIYVKYCV